MRYSMRAMLIWVTIIASGFGAAPWLAWRFRYDCLLEEMLENPRSPIGEADFDMLASDEANLCRRLEAIVRAPGDIDRRMAALELLAAFDPMPQDTVIEKLMHGMVTEVCLSNISPLREIPYSVRIQWWTGSGRELSQEDRALLRQHALVCQGSLRSEWMGVLVAIGGRKEIELVVAHATDDMEQWLVIAAHLSHLRWQGLLPHAEQWINDPRTAEYALSLSVLHDTPRGQAILLKYITDPDTPPELRTVGAYFLAGSPDGVELLRSRSITPPEHHPDDRFPHYFFGTEPIRVEEFADNNGESLWDALVGGVANPNKWLRFPVSHSASTAMKNRNALFRELFYKATLKSLQVLSDQPHLTTGEQWIEWLSTAPMRVVSHREILQLVIDHPSCVHSPPIFQRLWPRTIVVTDYLPEYEQMLHSPEERVREVACAALMTHTDSAEALHVAIGLLESPSQTEFVHGPLPAIRNRFAVNFFNDIEAWRKWEASGDPFREKLQARESQAEEE